MRKKLKVEFITTSIILLFFLFVNTFGFAVSGYAAENTKVNSSNKISSSEDVCTNELPEGDVCTKEIIEAKSDNPYFIDESEIEPDALVSQEDISYDGDLAGQGLNLLGRYQGLTYYSQADKRWANDLYTSTGNRTQTYKSSGCGPTAAAMIVSSAKGTVLPTTIGDLFVKRGYRTENSGTAWSAFSFIADYFKFKEYYSESSFDKALSYLSQKNSNGTSKYYIVCSVRKRFVYKWWALCSISGN